MEHYINLALKAIFVENLALTFFLGMCSFLAVSKRVETAVGLGIAVIFVLTITSETRTGPSIGFSGSGDVAAADLKSIDEELHERLGFLISGLLIMNQADQLMLVSQSAEP